MTFLNVLGVLGVLDVLYVLNVLHVLNVLNKPMDASLACWALFVRERRKNSRKHEELDFSLDQKRRFLHRNAEEL